MQKAPELGAPAHDLVSTKIEANQRNPTKSTGPSTEEGKRRSRRNAVRHGLCAETVIEVIDIEDYRAFEAAIIADYDAQTAVERELVLRLLWRLRRATSIETDLLRIQAEILRDRRDGQAQLAQATTFRVIDTATSLRYESTDDWNDRDARADHQAARTLPFSPSRDIAPRDLALCFQRLANFDNGVFERLGRYETALWRQMVQILFLLQAARRR